MTKRCTVCKKVKALEEFHKHRGMKDGRYTMCKICSTSRTKEWRAKNPEKSRSGTRKWQKDNPEKFARSQRARDLRVKYGITIEHWDAMFAAQKGLCAICGRPPRTTGGHGHYRFMVDHDHATHAIRGLVHSKCNLMLGYADDDPAILIAAIEYLARYSNRGEVR